MRKYLFDLGTHNGDSVDWFYQNTGNFYRKRGDNLEDYFIYCVEPNASHFNLTGKFGSNQRIKVIEKAAFTHNNGVLFKNAPESLSSCVCKYNMQSYDEAYSKLEKLPSFNIAEFLDNVIFQEDYVIVKIDIESSEYDIIPEMLKRGLFNKINELYIEFHHTIEGWDKKKEELSIKILEQCPSIYFDKNWQ